MRGRNNEGQKMVKERKTNKGGTENDKSAEVRMASERKNKGE
jgi:hypothetical protein